ncbi:MAG: metallophosphoesterase, partial [Thiohalomonadales bacterium]
YILGNHEFYRQEYHSLLKKVADLCDNTNVFLLNKNAIEINKVRFLGVTLWTDYAVSNTAQDLAMYCAKQQLADHRLIAYKSMSNYTKFTPEQALLTHKKELNWLEKQFESPYDGKTIVVTHHGPHTVCQHPAFPVNELSGAFHSDLDWFIEMYDIDVWMFGHSHANVDVLVNDTRIVSNQAGYPGENVAGFTANLLIEV